MKSTTTGLGRKPILGMPRRRVLDPILDEMQVGVAVLRLEDPQDPGSFRILSLNPAAALVLDPDQPADRALGMTVREAYPGLLTTSLFERCAEVVGGTKPEDVGDVRGAWNSERWFGAKAFPLPDSGVGIVFDDVTVRREADEHIRRNERQLARAQQLGCMGSWVWDTRSNRVRWSEELHRIYGRPRETFEPTFAGFLECVHPDDRPMVEATVRQSLERREPFRIRERIVRPDGEIRVLDSYGDVDVDERGTVEMFGLCRDITEDQRAEEALRESEQRFTTTVQGSPLAICIMALDDGRLTAVNPRFLELLGYDCHEEVVGKRAVDVGLWPQPGQRDQIVEQLRRDHSIRETSVTYRTRAGQSCRALAAVELIKAGGQECMLTAFWRL